MHHIYIIQYTEDRRIYVGQSCRPQNRWSAHKSIARKCWLGHNPSNCFYIHRAMAKYGIDNFVFQTIEEHESQKSADEAEVFWIDFFQSRIRGKGFNLVPGGMTAPILYGPDNPRYGVTGPDHPNYGKPAPNRLFSDEQEVEICKRYSNDLIPITKLAKEYNCDVSTLDKLLRRHDVPILGNAVFSKGKHYSQETEFQKGQEAHNKRFTAEKEQEICERYINEKLNTTQLAKLYGCHKSIIARMLDRNSIRKRKRGLTDEQKQQILIEYEKIRSARKVADKFGVNKSTILRLVRKQSPADNSLYTCMY